MDALRWVDWLWLRRGGLLSLFPLCYWAFFFPKYSVLSHQEPVIVLASGTDTFHPCFWLFTLGNRKTQIVPLLGLECSYAL